MLMVVAGWGQNGFIKIFRNTDGGSGPGQCGLAVEASYPTGGFLTPGGQIPIFYRALSLWNTIVEYFQQNFDFLVYSVAFVFVSSFGKTNLNKILLFNKQYLSQYHFCSSPLPYWVYL